MQYARPVRENVRVGHNGDMQQLSLTPALDTPDERTHEQVAQMVATLDAARRARNWTYAQLARRADVTTATAKAVLCGEQMPHLHTFAKLAGALGSRLHLGL